jgi:phosphohistidine phosphatase SixA
MKTLYIIRHAKSSWAVADQPDFERGLNERGKKDAPRMGKRLKEKNIHPDLIVSSSAKRAYSTAKKIAKVLNYPKEQYRKHPYLRRCSLQAPGRFMEGCKLGGREDDLLRLSEIGLRFEV